MTGRLAGKVAVVVGAGQTPGHAIGNGRATAVLFAREGARVLCVDRKTERAEETVAQIAAECGEAAAFTADITREADCAALVAAAVERFGRIDVLHNNVGGGAGDGPPDRLEADAFDRIMALNLRGMWLTIKAALPALREAKGCIVNVSSLASVAPAGILAYELSKAGVNKLTTSVAAQEARRGVRCNAILPGLIDTPMAIQGWAAMNAEEQATVRERRNKRVPLGAMGEAWDVAWAAVYLASDEARFVTGALLPVDGGMGVRVG